jgi:DNA-binding LytR/AlgR family response regulator
MSAKVIIIDDEPRAHKVLENYIQRLPELELIGMFTNAMKAIDFLKANTVNIVLLDITMPKVDGFTFLAMLKQPPHIIFTTAHSEYALDSYEFNAVDYLKKPIPFDRFAKAIKKAMTILQSNPEEKKLPDSINLKIDGETKTIPFETILYFSSLGNYIKIHTTSTTLMVHITTKEIETQLPKEFFLRIHKSYIVNKSKIKMVTEEEVVTDGAKLPIGKTFKKYVKETQVLGKTG